jgi:hypothetical protein
MKRTLIRYKAKPERADENEALIRNVFKELHEKAPEGGTRYAVLRLADGSFVHIVQSEAGEGAFSIPSLAAFKEFQSTIRDRIAEGPVQNEVTIIGNYRMLAE